MHEARPRYYLLICTWGMITIYQVGNVREGGGGALPGLVYLKQGGFFFLSPAQMKTTMYKKHYSMKIKN